MVNFSLWTNQQVSKTDIVTQVEQKVACSTRNTCEEVRGTINLTCKTQPDSMAAFLPAASWRFVKRQLL